jgi:hypothetical protein
MYSAKNGLIPIDSILNINNVHHLNLLKKNQHVKHMHMIKQNLNKHTCFLD